MSCWNNAHCLQGDIAQYCHAGAWGATGAARGECKRCPAGYIVKGQTVWHAGWDPQNWNNGHTLTSCNVYQKNHDWRNPQADRDCGPGRDYLCNPRCSALGGNVSGQPSDTAAGCVACLAGKYADDGKACKPCPAGKYQNSHLQTQCINCVAGKYSTVSGSSRESDCQSCPAGTNSGAGSGSLAACLCVAGKYKGSSDVSCISCPVGQYASGSGRRSCRYCSDGEETNRPGLRGSTGCVPCGAGMYRDGGGVAQSCQPCGSGLRPNDDGGIGTHVSAPAKYCIGCGEGGADVVGVQEWGPSGATACDIVSCKPGYNKSTGCKTCDADFHVSGNTCTACAPGTTRAAGDVVSGSETSCTATLCAANEYVSSNVCTACAAGKTNAARNDASGSDTTCDETKCNPNEYVSSNACIACPDNSTRPAGDYASGADTFCYCPVDYHVAGKCYSDANYGDEVLDGGNSMYVDQPSCEADGKVWNPNDEKCYTSATYRDELLDNGDPIYTNKKSCEDVTATCTAINEADTGLCDAVTDLNNAAACEGAGACTYAKPVWQSENGCVACPAGKSYPWGGDPIGRADPARTGYFADTKSSCVANQCGFKEHVVSNECVQCPDGLTNDPRDDASGPDTPCDCDPGKYFSLARC